jgi:hypothetical protein
MNNQQYESYNLSFLIPTSLEYLDTNNEKYSDFYKSVKESKTVKNDLDMQRNKIIFSDDKGKTILESEYEVIGLYYNKYNLWCWAWAIPILKKNETYIIKKLLNYALEIDLSLKENQQFKFIKTQLINSRSKITDELQLDIHLALASYLSKKKVIYKKKFFLRDDDPENYIIYYLFIINEPEIKKKNSN